jgi:hypothetical protein
LLAQIRLRSFVIAGLMEYLGKHQGYFARQFDVLGFHYDSKAALKSGAGSAIIPPLRSLL